MSATISHSTHAAPPRHVAVIMDGNGRWAKARGLPRIAGHKKGAEALRELLPKCPEIGIKYLTIYAFSSENWNRPQGEVTDLMELLRFYLEREIKTLHKNNVRIRIIGNTALLDAKTRRLIDEAETLTKENDALHLTVALSYGARDEIARAMQTIAKSIQTGDLSLAQIDESCISFHLDTRDLPDPDLLIRTGGEQRLSNFLLWQHAYTELFFSPVLWPDFSPTHLEAALADYMQRERRYGNTPNG
jgi:undecaprenyl diphosphate synthase